LPALPAPRRSQGSAPIRRPASNTLVRKYLPRWPLLTSRQSAVRYWEQRSEPGLVASRRGRSGFCGASPKSARRQLRTARRRYALVPIFAGAEARIPRLRHGRARHGHPVVGRVLSFDRPDPSPRWLTGHPAVRHGCHLRPESGHSGDLSSRRI
jgi:hypothetical protein